MSGTRDRQLKAVSAALMVVTLVLFAPVLRFRFLNYDYDRYFTDNKMV
jgi:hypothetical protein